jgi:hypothetical protein
MLSESEGQVCGRMNGIPESLSIFELGWKWKGCICCEKKVTKTNEIIVNVIIYKISL